MRWYNTEHRHSKINFVTPQQRHQGLDSALLARRQEVLEAARQASPTRWGSRPVRDCQPVGAVTLNPAKEAEIKQAA